MWPALGFPTKLKFRSTCDFDDKELCTVLILIPSKLQLSKEYCTVISNLYDNKFDVHGTVLR